MAGLTLEAMVGERLSKVVGKGDRHYWRLDNYPRRFLRKLYPTIAAMAMQDITEDKKQLITINDFAVYALRVLTAPDAETFFHGERPIGRTDLSGFYAEIAKIREKLSKTGLSPEVLEQLIYLNALCLQEGGQPLKEACSDIRNIAFNVLHSLTQKHAVPYLTGTAPPTGRAQLYKLVLE